MSIDVRKDGNVSILVIAGRMTLGEAEAELRQRFLDLLEDGERRFLFDMSDVSYLDSACVGETLACNSRAREREAVIKVVVRPQGRVHRDFLVADLDKVLDIYTDEDAALASFRA